MVVRGVDRDKVGMSINMDTWVEIVRIRGGPGWGRGWRDGGRFWGRDRRLLLLREWGGEVRGDWGVRLTQGELGMEIDGVGSKDEGGGMIQGKAGSKDGNSERHEWGRVACLGWWAIGRFQRGKRVWHE